MADVHVGRNGPPSDDAAGLPRSARIYLGILGLATLAAAGRFYIKVPTITDKSDWIAFAILATAATVAHLFPVKAPRNNMYHTSTVFLVAAALLLPPELLVLIPLVQTVPEWLKERYPWPIQVFNVSNYTLDALAAWGAAALVTDHAGGLITNANARVAVAGLAAAVAFVAVNHILVAVILKTARGHSFRATGLFSIESISIDLILAIIGVSLAAFWKWNPWLIFAAVAPLVGVYRSVSVPQLQAEARVDPKTGLYNARYFATTLAAEIARAARFERPMSLIMADLDLLRDINNSYGHLAGDAVLQGIAEIFRAQLRHYDVPARFGGEEFSILLPETPPDQAMEIAERIRRAVAETEFEVETAAEPVRATVSIGVAAFPKDGIDANELIHQADLAVYRAKLQGRNRVLGASSEPLLLAARARRQAARRARGRRAHDAAARRRAARRRRRSAASRARTESTARASSRSRRASAFVVGTVSVVGHRRRHRRADLRAEHRRLRAARRVRARRRGPGAVARARRGRGLDLRQRRRLARRRRAVRLSRRPAARADRRDRRVERAPPVAPSRALQHRNPLARFARRRLGYVDSRLGGGADERSSSAAALGIVGGAVYFAVNMGLLSLASGVEGHESPWRVFHERFAWLLPHYVVYGFMGAVIGARVRRRRPATRSRSSPCRSSSMRKTQEAYLKHTQKSALKLREAADTIQSQNVSLEQANRLLRERSTAAMESLSATVDARDSYTAGHSRRVQQLALAIGRELGLSQAELDLLGHAALFHDIGKLAIPGRDPPQAREPHGRGVGADAAPRRGGRAHHRPPRLPPGRGAGDPAPPRALRRHRLPGPDRRARRSRSAPGSSTSPTRSTRC